MPEKMVIAVYPIVYKQFKSRNQNVQRLNHAIELEVFNGEAILICVLGI